MPSLRLRGGMLAVALATWGCGVDPSPGAPSVRSVSPSVVEVGATVNLTVEGAGFRVPLATSLAGPSPDGEAPRVTLGGLPLAAVVVDSPERMTGRLEAGLLPGAHTLVVTLADGSQARLEAAVTVVPAVPVALAFLEPSRRVESGTCSTPVQVELRDRRGEPASATSVLEAVPKSGDGTFRFFRADDATCDQEVTTVPVPPGATTFAFRVRPGTQGVHALGVEAPGLAPDWQDWEVTSPAERAPDTFLHLGGRTTVAPGETLAVVVAARTDGSHQVARLEVEAVGALARQVSQEGPLPGDRLWARLKVPTGAEPGAVVSLLAEARDELGRRGYDAAQLTVGPPEPVSLTCTPPAAGAVVGEPVRLAARLLRSDGRSIDVGDQASWTVHPAGAATMDRAILTGGSVGPVAATVQWAGLEATCELALRDTPLRVWPPRLLLGLGGEAALTLEAWDGQTWTPVGGALWTSADPARVAVVDPAGGIRAAPDAPLGTVAVRGCLALVPDRCVEAQVWAGSEVTFPEATGTVWLQGHQAFERLTLPAGTVLRADAEPVVLQVESGLEVAAGAALAADGRIGRPGPGRCGLPGPGGGAGGRGGLPGEDGLAGEGGGSAGQGGQAGSQPGAGSGGAHWGPGGPGGGGTPGGVPGAGPSLGGGAGGGGGAGTRQGEGGGGGGGGGVLTLLLQPATQVHLDGEVTVRGGDGRHGRATGGGGGAGGTLQVWSGGGPVAGTGTLRLTGGHGGAGDPAAGGCVTGGGGAGGILETDGALAATLHLDLEGGLGGPRCEAGPGGGPGAPGALTVVPAP